MKNQGYVMSLLVCALIMASGTASAQKQWTWYISGTNVTYTAPATLDVTISVRANSPADVGKLGNNTIRGTMSADLYDFGAGHDPLIQANYLGGTYPTTLTNPSGGPNWQRNCVLDAVNNGTQVTVAGIAVTQIRFTIVNPAGSSAITLGTLQQTYEDDNTTAAAVTYDNTAGNTPLPIQLAAFTAAVVQGNKAQIRWTTLTETDNYGFEVQRSADGGKTFATIPNSFIAGHGTTVDKHDYAYTDRDPVTATTYYRLKQIDRDGTVHYTEGILAEGKPVPTAFSMDQNYPNPFNPVTSIEFALPRDSKVTLEVYNVLGQRVATLVNEVRPAGYYSERFDASSVASGIYFYRLSTAETSILKKMLVLK
jgi:hypothetical protein